VQPVQIDLARFSGRTPVELLDGTRFPPITDAPYVLSLSPYGFMGFHLTMSPAS
jgi:maltose alpha-D-glucosyltransferase/alpha-amylase